MSLPDGLAELDASLGAELAAGLLLTTGALVAAGAGLVHAATAASRPRARSSRLIMRHLLESGPRRLGGPWPGRGARGPESGLRSPPPARDPTALPLHVHRGRVADIPVVVPSGTRTSASMARARGLLRTPLIEVDARYGRNATLLTTAAPRDSDGDAGRSNVSSRGHQR
jgi:hypothetical protein